MRRSRVEQAIGQLEEAGVACSVASTQRSALSLAELEAVLMSMIKRAAKGGENEVVFWTYMRTSFSRRNAAVEASESQLRHRGMVLPEASAFDT